MSKYLLIGFMRDTLFVNHLDIWRIV